MRAYSLIAFLFIFSAAFGQETDSTSFCDFRTGNFYVLQGENDTCFITRTEDRQTESCTNSTDEFKLIVVWLKEDKKYILRDIGYNPSTKPRVMRNDIIMTIMEVGTDYHIVHMKGQGIQKRLLKVYCN